MRVSNEYRAQACRVADFRDCYLALIAQSRIRHDEVFFSHRRRVPMPGHEAEFAHQFAVVARAAGAACVGPGGIHHEIAGWRRSLDDVDQLNALTVVETCESIIGILEQQAHVMDARSRTLAGRVAAFVGFPYRVRDLVATGHPRLRKAAFGMGIAGQVLVAVLGTTTAAALAALAATGWTALTG